MAMQEAALSPMELASTGAIKSNDGNVGGDSVAD